MMMNNDDNKVNQLFDKYLLFDISIACIIAYLVETGCEDENTIDYDKIANFVNKNLSYITEQIVNGGDENASQEEIEGD